MKLFKSKWLWLIKLVTFIAIAVSASIGYGFALKHIIDTHKVKAIPAGSVKSFQ